MDSQSPGHSGLSRWTRRHRRWLLERGLVVLAFFPLVLLSVREMATVMLRRDSTPVGDRSRPVGAGPGEAIGPALDAVDPFFTWTIPDLVGQSVPLDLGPPWLAAEGTASDELTRWLDLATLEGTDPLAGADWMEPIGRAPPEAWFPLDLAGAECPPGEILTFRLDCPDHPWPPTIPAR